MLTGIAFPLNLAQSVNFSYTFLKSTESVINSVKMKVSFEAKFSKDFLKIRDGRLLKRIKELILVCKEVDAPTEINQLKKLKGYDTFYRLYE
jgi:hypothetical protein